MRHHCIKYIRYYFQLHGLLVNATVMFFIIGEATSIVENSVKLGVPIPEQLKTD